MPAAPSTPIEGQLILRWIAGYSLVQVIKPSEHAAPDLLNFQLKQFPSKGHFCADVRGVPADEARKRASPSGLPARTVNEVVMTDEETPDDENPPLPWPRADKPSKVRGGLFVSDAELYRRLGVGPRTGRLAVLVLERSGQFPKKDPLFGNKRYWPAVVKKLDDRYTNVVSPINPMVVGYRRDPLDGPETIPRPRLRGVTYTDDGYERSPAMGAGKVKVRAPDGRKWIEDAKETDPDSWQRKRKFAPRKPVTDK
jgi:hypothetical protein